MGLMTKNELSKLKQTTRLAHLLLREKKNESHHRFVAPLRAPSLNTRQLLRRHLQVGLQFRPLDPQNPIAANVLVIDCSVGYGNSHVETASHNPYQIICLG